LPEAEVSKIFCKSTTPILATSAANRELQKKNNIHSEIANDHLTALIVSPFFDISEFLQAFVIISFFGDGLFLKVSWNVGIPGMKSGTHHSTIPVFHHSNWGEALKS
jgi:hypothetical protein